MSQVKKIMGLTGFLDDQHGRLASDQPTFLSLLFF